VNGSGFIEYEDWEKELINYHQLEDARYTRNPYPSTIKAVFDLINKS
jgi:hypothetical protein